MTPEHAAAWALSRLNTSFHYYDRRQHDAVLEFFVPDAAYELRGRRMMQEHAEILDALNARPKSDELTGRHIVAATYFHSADDSTAQGTITLLGYGGCPRTELGPAPHTVATGGHIFELADHYRLDDGGWKITHRTARQTLTPISG